MLLGLCQRKECTGDLFTQAQTPEADRVMSVGRSQPRALPQSMQSLFRSNAAGVQVRCNWVFRCNAIRCADQCVFPHA